MMRPTPYLYILTLMILSNLWSCKKKEPIFLPSVSILSSKVDNVNSLVVEAQINENNSFFSISSYGFLLVNKGDIPASIDAPSILRNKPVDKLDDKQKFKAQFDGLMMDKSYDIFAYLMIECDCKDSNSLILSTPLNDFVDKLQISSQYHIDNNELNITSVVLGLVLNNTVEENGFFFRQDNNFLSDEKIFEQIENGENTIQSETLASGNFPIFQITINLDEANNYIQPYAIFNNELILGENKEILDNQIVGWGQIITRFSNPGNLFEATSFVINDKAYIGTGIKQVSNATIVSNEFWEFNDFLLFWTQKADVPEEGRTNAFGFAANGKGYIGGGESTVHGVDDRQDVWEYEPLDNSWTKKLDFGITETEGLTFGSTRSKAMVFVINNRPFVGFGMTTSGVSSRLYEFLPDDIRNGFNSDGIPLGAWINKGLLSESISNENGRVNPVSFSIRDKGYMGYGLNANGYSTDFFEYNPEGTIAGLDIDGNPKGAWRKMNSNGISRQKAMSFVIGDYAYMGGGGNLGIGGEAPTYKDWWRFDPSGDGVWTPLEDIGLSNIDSATGFALHGKGYIYGGRIADEFLQITNGLYYYTPSD